MKDGLPGDPSLVTLFDDISVNSFCHCPIKVINLFFPLQLFQATCFIASAQRGTINNRTTLHPVTGWKDLGLNSKTLQGLFLQAFVVLKVSFSTLLPSASWEAVPDTPPLISQLF